MITTKSLSQENQKGISLEQWFMKTKRTLFEVADQMYARSGTICASPHFKGELGINFEGDVQCSHRMSQCTAAKQEQCQQVEVI